MRYRLTLWWVKVTVVWAASRILSTSLLLFFASRQAPNPWSGAHPDYLAFAQFWDSTWYHIVAVSGYPSVLPMTSDGHVAENAWAFLPAYPMLVRCVMVVTSLPWEPVSVAVSFAFSLLSALMIYRLFLLRLPPATALFAVFVTLWFIVPRVMIARQ